MKFAVTLVLSFFILSVKTSQWRDIKSPLDSPHYKEIISKLMNEFAYDGRSIKGKVVNGEKADLGQFPYQVYMYLYTGVGSAYLCGGSIIHKRWILTAGHCVDDIVKVEVFLGAITRYTNQVGSSIKTITVTRNRSIIPHPNYDPNFTANDVGLVELPEEVPIENIFIGLIALPQGLDLTRSLVGVRGVVSGFGRSSDSQLDNNAVLNFITLPIADNSVCSSFFREGIVTADNICLLSVNNGSACSGDSGGPLTIVSNGQNVQVGIVSFGSAGGCEKGFPQVFARVSSFISWIEVSTGLRFS